MWRTAIPLAVLPRFVARRASRSTQSRARRHLSPHGSLQFGEPPGVLLACQRAAEILSLALQGDAFRLEVS
jgi:hypothetical protein